MLTPRRVAPPHSIEAEPAAPAAQDNKPANSPHLPPLAAAEPAAAAPPPTQSAPVTAPPLFRARADLGKTGAPGIPPVIPIVRAPDDPGIDDEAVSDEFAESINPAQGQAGGWRGFLSRWGG